MAEVKFYGDVLDFTVSQFIQDIEEVSDGELFVRLNTAGGDPLSGWGMIAKFKEFDGEKEVQVDGQASSMGSVFVLFANKAKAIRQAVFVMHRASAFFSDPTTDKVLKIINAEFRKAFEEKINIERFEEIGGVTLDRFFDEDEERVDVTLTAFQAQEIGLVDEVIELSPTEFEAVNKLLIAASIKPIEDQNEDIDMTLQELQTKHPVLYSQVVAEAQSKATKAEGERIQAWLAFNDVAPEEVKAGIASGEAPSLVQISAFAKLSAKAEMAAEAQEEGEEGEEGKTEKKGKKKVTAKAKTQTTAKVLEGDAAPKLDTEEPTEEGEEGEKSEKEKNLSNFEASTKKILENITITV